MSTARPPIPDARLVEMARSGDDTAFDMLVNRYQRAVHAVAFSVLADREAALDVLQESFISAYRQLHSLDDSGKFGPWVCAIARNQAKRHYRDSIRRREREISFPIVDALEHQETCDPRIAQVREALEMLTEIEANIVTLFYMEGYLIRDCASLLGVPEGTVKRRLHDARQRLKKEMIDIVTQQFREFALPEDHRVVIDRPSGTYSAAPSLVWFKDRWALIWQDAVNIWGAERWAADQYVFWVSESSDARSWSEPRRIDLLSQLPSLPKLCVVGDLLVMHTHNHHAGVMVATTPDLVRWTNRPMLRLGDISRSDVFSTGNELFLVYSLWTRSESMAILRSLDTGMTWEWLNAPYPSPEYWVTDTTGLAVGDTLYVAWKDWRHKKDASEEVSGYTRLSRSDDGGATWSEPIVVESLTTEPPNGSMCIRLTSDGDRLVIVQENALDAHGEVWLAFSSDGGASWSEKAVCSSGMLLDPAVALADDGSLIIAGSSRTGEEARPWVVHSHI